MSRTSPTPPPAVPAALPVLQEDIQIRQEAVAHGRVRVRVTPRQVEQRLPVARSVETTTVDRHRVERVVDRRTPPWQDGDALVIPVYEERVVTAVQLVLVEEVRVRTRDERHSGTATVVSRHDAVAVERQDADGHWQRDTSGPVHPFQRSTLMQQTLVAMFNTHAAADVAKARLEARGIAPSAIQVTDARPLADEGAPPAGTTSSTAAGAEDTGVLAGVRRFFADLFSSSDEDEVRAYSDAVAQGGAFVKVQVDDDMQLALAREELAQAGAADIDAQLESWRSARTGPSVSGAASGTASGTAAGTGTAAAASGVEAGATGVAARGDADGVIPVVQESVAVGKRSVRAGGLRVYARVVEEPVRESVSLREERATVDRRTVDRPATQAELTGMAERTIEVTEMVERPVVEKTARVVEEVVVGKEVRQTRTVVEETARHTEVDVETLSGETGAGSLSAHDRLDRQDFDTHFAASGHRYEDLQPAYAFGRSLRAEERYTGMSWDEIEPQARASWAAKHPDSPWERAKDAARRAWDRLTE